MFISYIKTKMREQNFVKSKTITYKNLLDILKRDGCKSIVLNERDAIEFTKYVVSQNYRDKLKFEFKNNERVVSKTK